MSLAELMIAMSLGLMLTLGIATLFVQTRQSFAQDEQVATMQANLRFAMEKLVEDVVMTGFWGGLHDPGLIAPGATLPGGPGNDCGPPGVFWAFNVVNPLGGANNATPTQAVQNFSCLTASNFQAGTDILAIKRVRGMMTAPAAGNRVLLCEAGTNGDLFIETQSGTECLQAGANFWELMPMVYFIRNHSHRPGDDIPTLCRMRLEAGNMTEECFVEGIEQMQVQYGIDTNSNGIANQYVAAPNAVQFGMVSTVRIHLVARSLRPQQRYQNAKTYVLGDFSYAPNDSFYRRSASTTVILRNPANLRNMSSN